LKNLVPFLLIMAALAGTGALAHHDIADDIDINAPIEIVGQFVGVDWGSQHTVFHIAIERSDAPSQLWHVQADSTSLLSRNGFTNSTAVGLNTVAVVMYLSRSSACENECQGYGLSLTDPKGNSYTLRRDITAMLNNLRSGN